MPFVSGEYLDWIDERKAEAAADAAKRARGEFHPFYVHRPNRIRFGWTVYQKATDLNSTAPHWWSLPCFWRFYTAARVAARLQQAFEDGRAHPPDTDDPRNTK